MGIHGAVRAWGHTIQENLSALLTGRKSSVLMRNSSGSLAVRTSATLLGFVMSVVLARLVGAEHYGRFVYLMAGLNVVLIPACLGFDRLFVREAAADASRGDLARTRRHLPWALRLVLGTSVALALIGAAIVYAASPRQIPDLRLASLVCLALVPIMAVTRLQQGVLQGLSAVAFSQIPEFIAQPAFLLFSAAVVSSFSIQTPTTGVIMQLNLIGGVIALGLGWIFLRRILYKQEKGGESEVNPDLLPQAGLHMALVSGVFVVNEQLAPLLLGLLGRSSDVAAFAAADRWSGFTVFMLQVANLAIAPVFAGLYATGRMGELQHLFTRSAQIVTAFAVPPVLALIIAPRFFLAAFGGGFERGSAALTILALGQLVNAVTGSVGLLLMMSGHERSVVRSAAFGVAVSALLGALLIPVGGATGAALAVSASMVLSNTLLAISVWRKLRIYPTGFARILARLTSTGAWPSHII